MTAYERASEKRTDFRAEKKASPANAKEEIRWFVGKEGL